MVGSCAGRILIRETAGNIARNAAPNLRLAREEFEQRFAGYTEYTEPDAARCYSIANIGLQILSQLDKAEYVAVFPSQKA